MDYLFLSDILWYCGHILTGLAIIFTHNNNYSIALLCVFVGQFITIISRPIGRIKCETNCVCRECGYNLNM
jgi:hypothetical protein